MDLGRRANRDISRLTHIRPKRELVRVVRACQESAQRALLVAQNKGSDVGARV